MGYHLHVASKTIAEMIAVEVEWKQKVEEWNHEMTLSRNNEDGDFEFQGTQEPGRSDGSSDHWANSEDNGELDDQLTEKEE